MFKKVVSALFYSFVFASAAFFAAAQPSVVKSFTYDAAGNLIGVDSVNQNPPPDFILNGGTAVSLRLTEPLRLTGVGSGLTGVIISGDHPNLISTAVFNSDTSVTFDAVAGQDVPLGTHLLTFTTGAGSTTKEVEVVLNTPVINTGIDNIDQNSSRGYSLNGFGLTDVTVTSNNAELSVSDVSSTATSVNFTLTAGPSLPLGTYVLTFTTSVGSTTETVTVIDPGGCGDECG